MRYRASEACASLGYHFKKSRYSWSARSSDPPLRSRSALDIRSEAEICGALGSSVACPEGGATGVCMVFTALARSVICVASLARVVLRSASESLMVATSLERSEEHTSELQ